MTVLNQKQFAAQDKHADLSMKIIRMALKRWGGVIK